MLYPSTIPHPSFLLCLSRNSFFQKLCGYPSNSRFYILLGSQKPNIILLLFVILNFTNMVYFTLCILLLSFFNLMWYLSSLVQEDLFMLTAILYSIIELHQSLCTALSMTFTAPHPYFFYYRHDFLCTCMGVFLGYTPRSEIAALQAFAFSALLGNCRIALPSDCTILHSHQRYTPTSSVLEFPFLRDLQTLQIV